MPSNLLFFIPASWIILVPLTLIISSVVFFAGLKIFMIEENITIFKKYFLKVFLSVFFSNLMCSVLIFLIGLIPNFGYLIYHNSFNQRSNLGILLTLFAIVVSILGNVILLYKIIFINLKINKTAKKYISIIIAIFCAPYILLSI